MKKLVQLFALPALLLVLVFNLVIPTSATTNSQYPTATRTRTPTRTRTRTPTRTQTGASPTATRTNTPGAATNTPTQTPTQPTGACSPVTGIITAPFDFTGAGTFCWQSSDLGVAITSNNTSNLSVNGVNFTNMWVAVGSLPPKINGFWYVSFVGPFNWSHFQVFPGSTPTPVITPTVTHTPPPGACSPVTATISAPFISDGLGTFCWKSNNLGSFINNWNNDSVTINGLNISNIFLAASSYPPQIDGFWYIKRISTITVFSHFETCNSQGPNLECR